MKQTVIGADEVIVKSADLAALEAERDRYKAALEQIAARAPFSHHETDGHWGRQALNPKEEQPAPTCPAGGHPLTPEEVAQGGCNTCAMQIFRSDQVREERNG